MDTRSTLIILLLCASAAHAQYVVSARAGTIHFTEGEVYLNPRMAAFKSSWEKRQRRSKVWGYTDSKRTYANCAYLAEALR